jgi:molecular chaperone HtpG
MRKSPFIERLMSKGYEVLFMADAIDEYMCQRLTEYKKPHDEKKYKFVNVAKEGALFDEENKSADFEPLCKHIKEVLDDQVERVLVSSRLSKAPAAIVTGSYGWTANMARIMKAQALSANQDMAQHMQPKKIFEINPEHKLIIALKERVSADAEDKGAKDIVQMLYDASLLASGFMLDDASSFVGRLHRLMALGLSLEGEDNTQIDEVQVDDEPKADAATKMEELD